MATAEPVRQAPVASEAVEAFVQALARRVQPECIVLFGSYAAGAPRPYSDLDLLVVMETDRRPLDRTDPFRDLLSDAPAPTDVLVRTPEEVRYWRGTPNHIVHEAFEKGTVVYRAPGAGSFPSTRARPMEMVQEFLKKADNDLMTARQVLQMEDGPTDTPAFHAQQAAEKGLKAILTFHEIDAPYTHDLERLLDLVPENPEQWAQLEPLRDDLEGMSKYGAQIRYPGSVEEPSRKAARRALEVAEAVVQLARTQAEEGGHGAEDGEG